MTKKLKTLIIFLLFSVVVFSSVSYAKECEVSAVLYERNSINFNLDIRRTFSNIFDALLEKIYSLVHGVDLNTTVNCAGTLPDMYPGNETIATITSSVKHCKIKNTKTCEALVNQLGGTGTTYGPDSYADAGNRVGGSIVGVAYAVENYHNENGVPVSLALFLNDNVSRLPFVGKALAQEREDYGHTLVMSVYNVWKVSRNLALGVMAIILLVVGFMIITRRQISQQAVVTVQYALPRLVISLFLIIFSYPIGAFITSLGWTLYHSAPEIITSLFSGTDLGVVLMPLGVMLTAIVGTILAVSVATFTFTILIVVVAVAAVMYLYFLFKVFFVYLKMVFSIISAPIEFAISAIPGNEAKMMDWFKRMFAGMLTLFAMGGVVLFGMFIAATIVSNVKETASGLGTVLSVGAPLFVLVYSYGMAIKMDKLIEGMIIGDPRKRR